MAEDLLVFSTKEEIRISLRQTIPLLSLIKSIVTNLPYLRLVITEDELNHFIVM